MRTEGNTYKVRQQGVLSGILDHRQPLWKDHILHHQALTIDYQRMNAKICYPACLLERGACADNVKAARDGTGRRVSASPSFSQPEQIFSSENWVTVSRSGYELQFSPFRYLVP